jgi:hypothetical protein
MTCGERWLATTRMPFMWRPMVGHNTSLHKSARIMHAWRWIDKRERGKVRTFAGLINENEGRYLLSAVLLLLSFGAKNHRRIFYLLTVRVQLATVQLPHQSTKLTNNQLIIPCETMRHIQGTSHAGKREQEAAIPQRQCPSFFPAGVLVGYLFGQLLFWFLVSRVVQAWCWLPTMRTHHSFHGPASLRMMNIHFAMPLFLCPIDWTT